MRFPAIVKETRLKTELESKLFRSKIRPNKRSRSTVEKPQRSPVRKGGSLLVRAAAEPAATEARRLRREQR